ncbi:ATP-binding protein [Flavobacterium difficile]|uniref:histidine kinase n=1 Tax=Flavobacterium difficile TaxID=2709659 RepID=A0ABX0I615_9FLAO|nr:ATP-binding protein [Flavobacterium difficile]NHM00916.1 tetratricopeptide repeat protein [Flavobacterium difficile]
MATSELEKSIEELLLHAHEVRINNLAKSIDLGEKALQLSRKENFLPLVAKCLSQLSLYYMITGKIEKSIAYSNEALVYFEALKDEMGIAHVKYTIAGVHYKTNNYHLGLIYFVDALKIYKKYDDFFNQSRAEKSIGTIYEYIGDDVNAFSFYKRAIKNAKQIHDTNLESNVYNNLSGLLLKSKKYKYAMDLIEKSIALKTESKDVRGSAFAYYGKGKVYLKLNDFENALYFFQKALEIHKEMGDVMGVSMVCNKMGQLYYNYDDLDNALFYANEGIKIAKFQNITMINIKLYKLFYLIYKRLNNSELALKYLELFDGEKAAVLNSQTINVIENYDLLLKMKKLEQDAELEKERQEILNKKNDDELNAMRARQDFLSVMSHEIRTPLNAITTIIPLLKEQVSEEGQSLIENLKFASNNLINIVNDVLNFSKLDSKKEKLTLTPVSLEKITTNIVNVYNKVAVDKGISLILNIEIDPKINYLLDETKYTQILNNLISNAIKFTDKGSVKVTITILKSYEKFDYVLFEVIDTGEGIKEENLKEIFVSFSQIKPVLTRKQGGTGLGLAIVKKILELVKSEIKVKSQIGVGSTFYFKLKLERTELKTPVVFHDYTKLINKEILLVEDTAINAMLMKKLLQKWGIIVDHVENGKLAVEAVKAKKYDFILMDIHMPEMNGYEATKIIKTTENFNSKTPILALTADTLTEAEQDSITYFNGVLWKPFEIDKLYIALNKALG